MVAKYAAPPSGPALYDSDGRRDIILPFTSRQDSLVRMAVAPFPVIPLLFLLEFVVFPVLFVPLVQIMPVGATTIEPVVARPAVKTNALRYRRATCIGVSSRPQFLPQGTNCGIRLIKCRRAGVASEYAPRLLLLSWWRRRRFSGIQSNL